MRIWITLLVIRVRVEGLFITAFKRVVARLFREAFPDRFGRLRVELGNIGDYIGDGIASALPVHVFVVDEALLIWITRCDSEMLFDDALDALGEFIQRPCLAGLSAKMALLFTPVAANLLLQERIADAPMADVSVMAVIRVSHQRLPWPCPPARGAMPQPPALSRGQGMSGNRRRNVAQGGVIPNIQRAGHAFFVMLWMTATKFGGPAAPEVEIVSVHLGF